MTDEAPRPMEFERPEDEIPDEEVGPLPSGGAQPLAPSFTAQDWEADDERVWADDDEELGRDDPALE